MFKSRFLLVSISLKIKILIIICLFVFIVISCMVSYVEFGCANIISVGIGVGKIMFFYVEYVEIQKNPQVVIAKPNGAKDNQKKYMDSKGFIFKEQMGSMMFFENNMYTQQLVSFYLNKYYSKWIWR
ncbi:MAG: hypothetical protein LBP19_03265 [Treponema sp.]|jgi:hypothetical protein|nr:hypothetical protein [Treponema sp.]